MMRVIFAVIKAFLFYFLLILLENMAGYFMPVLNDPGMIKYLIYISQLILTGYFISKVCPEHVKKTALIFGVLLLILQYHEIPPLPVFIKMVKSTPQIVIDIILVIPYIFAGVYLRYFLVARKIYKD